MTKTSLSVPLTLEEFVAPKTTCLVMWDMQNGLAGRSIHLDRVKESTSRLLAAADKAGVMVAWSRHILPPLEFTAGPFLLFLMKKQKVDHPDKLKPSMQEGGEDTQFIPGFKPAPHHIVIEKSQPSLFVDTPFNLRLKTRGIKSIVLGGVATDIGIEFTARHAMATGYFPVIAEDACGAYSDEVHDRSVAFMRNWMPVVKSAEICDIWNKA